MNINLYCIYTDRSPILPEYACEPHSATLVCRNAPKTWLKRLSRKKTCYLRTRPCHKHFPLR